MVEISNNTWESFLTKYQNPHILQSIAWGQLKAEFGWQVAHIANEECGAQILIKRILPGIRFAYIPKGPVGGNCQQFWTEVDEICRRLKCVFLKVEPDLWSVENADSSERRE